MRLLHTSDWHVGRGLHGVHLLDHQAAYLDHLVELARAEKVDAVLVAGDVFDRAVPPVDAVTLLGETLRRLAEVTQVIAIPGNHDSAARLGFASALWREQVRLVGQVGEVGSPCEVVAGEERALIYPIPYLDPDQARVALADGEEPLARSHQAVVGAAMDRIRADAAARQAHGGPAAVVVMAHAFVVGGEASESERDIRVGGVDSIAASTFAGADYVALGHLHGPQRVGPEGGPTLRYAGSPLAYSFSEMHQKKSTSLVHLGPGGVKVEAIPAPVPRRLAELRGPLASILGKDGEGHTDDWLRVVVTDPARPERLVQRVRDRFPHALVVLHEAPAGTQREAVRVVAGSDPLSVARDFFRFATGGEATEAEMTVLRGALEDIRRAEVGGGVR